MRLLVPGTWVSSQTLLTIMSMAIVLFLAVPASADTIPCFQFFDLDDNQVPDGWTQTILYGGPGVADGAFWGRIVDGRAWLTQEGTLPPGTTAIRFEYDGNIAYSTSGLSNNVAVTLGSGVRYTVSDRHAIHPYGDYNTATMERSDTGEFHVSHYPFETTDYHYVVRFSEGLIEFVARKIEDGSVLFDLAVPETDLHLSEIEELRFIVVSTTDNSAWMDNLLVEMEGAPTAVETTSWGGLKALYR